MTKFYKVDISELENDPEVVYGALQDCWEENDKEGFLAILEIIARKHGMSRISNSTGINRQSLYNCLSTNGNPTLDTLMPILNELRIIPSFEPLGR